ncbi:MAG: heme-binding protein [Rickettsiales bacterium]|nr:heme-binding protein [Rickettsiales bacterium]
MSKKTIISLLAFIPFLTGCINAFGGYESPKYNVLEKSDNIELREYKKYIVAEVTLDNSSEDKSNDAFKILANYIFGGNKKASNIAMTSPVEIEQNEGENISMTAPVEIEKESKKTIMRFSMPSKYSLKTIPKPEDEIIKIYEVEGYKAAVIRFSWFFNEKNFLEKKKVLENFIKEKNLTAISEPIKAYYNPPFTLPFLKRNEIIIKVR